MNAITPDGWFKTGAIVTMDDESFCWNSDAVGGVIGYGWTTPIW
jgi:hypothetical protein